MRSLAGAATICIVTGLAQAQNTRDCDTFEANARNLIFPVAENIRSYANGAIRFIALDTGGEPACCSSHLMVLSPDPEYSAGQVCTLISNRDAFGFSDVDLSRARSSYDAAAGLRVRVPIELYNADGSGSTPDELIVTVNQQTGAVTVERGP